MDSGRLHNEKEAVKEIVELDIKDFPFIQNLQFGQKGEIGIDGVIVRERLSEDGNVIKTVKVSRTMQTTERRVA